MGKKLTGEQQGDLQTRTEQILNDLQDLIDDLNTREDVDDLVNLAHAAQDKLNQIVTQLEDIANA